MDPGTLIGDVLADVQAALVDVGPQALGLAGVVFTVWLSHRVGMRLMLKNGHWFR